MEKKGLKTGKTKQTRSKIAKATLRVGFYRITAHPDFGQRKNRSQADIMRSLVVSTNASGSSFKSVLRICQAAQVALLCSPILLADEISITDLEIT